MPTSPKKGGHAGETQARPNDTMFPLGSRKEIFGYTFPRGGQEQEVDPKQQETLQGSDETFAGVLITSLRMRRLTRPRLNRVL